MRNHGKLLLAVDLAPESGPLIDRTRNLYADDLEQLHVVHVLKKGMYDLQPANDSSEDPAHTQRLRDHTSIKLRELLNLHGIEVAAEKIFVTFGEPANEIKRLAAEICAETVIIGSHCKESGWLKLPGATTNCVIQGISSDVVAVRV